MMSIQVNILISLHLYMFTLAFSIHKFSIHDHTGILKWLLQPAACADLSGVVFCLSNLNVNYYIITGQMRTLYVLQIINCSFLAQKTFKKYNKNNWFNQ